MMDFICSPVPFIAGAARRMRSKNQVIFDDRVEYLATNNNSSINSFQKFFQTGMSPRESLVLKSIRQSIEKFISSTSGMLGASADGWIIYSKQDNCSLQRYFIKEKFSKPLFHQLEFQKEFRSSQLLTSFYEEKKQLYNELKKNIHKAKFIPDWTYYSWMRHKNRLSF